VQKQSGIMKINPVDKVIAEKQAKSVIDKLKDNKIDVNTLTQSDLNIMAEQIVHPLKHAEKVIPKESAKVLPFKYKRSFAEELADASKKGDFNRMQGIMKVDPKFKEVMKNVEKQKATEKLIRQRDLQKRPIPLDTIQYQTPEIAKLKGAERMDYLITDKDQTAKLLKKGVTSDDIIYAQDRYGMTAKDIMEASDSGFKFPFATAVSQACWVRELDIKMVFLRRFPLNIDYMLVQCYQEIKLEQLMKVILTKILKIKLKIKF